MAIAEPFCETYKPSVRTDGSCYWDEEPTVNSAKQSCNAKEEDEEERIIFWDSLFNTVHKNASVVTEFNLVTRHRLVSIALQPTLGRSASVTGFAFCGSASLGEAPSWAPSSLPSLPTSTGDDLPCSWSFTFTFFYVLKTDSSSAVDDHHGSWSIPGDLGDHFLSLVCLHLPQFLWQVGALPSHPGNIQSGLLASNQTSRFT